MRTSTFQADQHEQDRIQDLVDQLPKRVQVFTGFVRHRQHTTLIAHHQACHHDGDGTGEVQRARQGIAAGDERQGDQDFDLILVDTFQEPIGEIAQPQSKDDSAHGFLRE